LLRCGHSLPKQLAGFIYKNREGYTREQMAICRIPAPTFAEKARGDYFLKRFKALGLGQVHRDTAGNVLGRIKGKTAGRALVVSAHLDTVFPRQTALKVRRKRAILYGPGISDNACGLIGLLALAGIFRHFGLRPQRDIWLVANVQEESNGDLGGMKRLFAAGRLKHRIAELIALDGSGSARVTTRGVGSVRYRVTIQGPGGHSFGKFGVINPIHLLGGFISDFTEYPAPRNPKTTYNVGIIHGGTSINTIPETAFVEVDMRSQGRAQLRRLERYCIQCIEKTRRRGRQLYPRQRVAIIVKQIGARPVGATAHGTALVKDLTRIWRALGVPPVFQWLSTDANIPMSRGIPSVTIGIGGTAQGTHTLHEQYDTTGREQGLYMVICLVCSRAGC
jgi:acetylornithine deacetylase/succinyl-diaminopimelate desuccinylase-like protein